MRKLSIFLIALLTIMWFIAVPIHAADQNLNVTIESATLAVDKNGREYIRFIVPVDKQLQGVEYSDSVAVMAFGNMTEPAKAYKAGDQLNVIVKSREYQGNTSYTVLKFLE
jgi:hypothetical protein